MGERRAYTDTYNCGVSLTDWTLLMKSGEHVNPSVGQTLEYFGMCTHITDGLDEVISMNLI